MHLLAFLMVLDVRFMHVVSASEPSYAVPILPMKDVNQSDVSERGYSVDDLQDACSSKEQ